MKRLFLLLAFHAISSNASTCEDEYIISGNRTINLLPDIPFQIKEVGQDLYVARSSFQIIFKRIEDTENENESTHRFATKFLDEVYFFDIVESKKENSKKWEQYSAKVPRRGFGGSCKP